VQTIENQAAALTHTADMCANSGINVDDAAAAAAGLVNPLVESALLPAMRCTGAHTIHQLGHFCPQAELSTGSRFMEKNAKGKLVFTPLMANADKQLSLLNLSNQPELSFLWQLQPQVF